MSSIELLAGLPVIPNRAKCALPADAQENELSRASDSLEKIFSRFVHLRNISAFGVKGESGPSLLSMSFRSVVVVIMCMQISLPLACAVMFIAVIALARRIQQHPAGRNFESIAARVRRAQLSLSAWQIHALHVGQ